MAQFTNPEELKKYYEEQLPDELRVLLATLSGLIGNDPDDQIWKAAEKYLGFSFGELPIARYYLDRASLQIPEEELWFTELPHNHLITVEEFLALAVLGLERINHVHYNSTLTPDTEKVGYDLIEIATTFLEGLDAENLPELTIHGNPIYWRGEILQDIAQTLQKIDEPERAAAELRNELKVLYAEEKEVGHLNAGKASARAVMHYRLGAITDDLAEKMIGLRLEWENAEDLQFNRERLLTFVLGTAGSAIDLRSETLFKLRLDALKLVARAWAFMLIQDPIKTLKFSAKHLAKLF